MVEAVSDASEVTGHVFISYVREDRDRVDELEHALRAAGIPVWRDTENLWPGQDWRTNIRQAITNDALVFIACFSRLSLGKDKSYMNEELVLAVEQLRLRKPSDPWLIPVRFDECNIPDHDLGGGRMLGSVQRADLFGEGRGIATTRLITFILRILGRDPGEPLRRSDSGPRRTRPGAAILGIEPPPSEPPARGLVDDPAFNPLADSSPGTTEELFRRLGIKKAYWPEFDEEARASLLEPQMTSEPSAEREPVFAVKDYASPDGPAYLASHPPLFADDSYHRLVRAAIQANSCQAALELALISQRQRHTSGEICWLSLAERLGHPDAMPLARAYGRALAEEGPAVSSGTKEQAMYYTILAWRRGNDEAGAEVMAYKQDQRDSVMRTYFRSGFEQAAEEAAKKGSNIAAFHLAQLAVQNKKFSSAASLLEVPAKNGDVQAMYLLGLSLLDAGQRDVGRIWLRKASEKGNYEAKLKYASTSGARRSLRVLAVEVVNKFDATQPDVVYPAEFIRSLGQAALDRGLTSEALECLRRAASLHDSAAMISLSHLYIECGELAQAEEQLRDALHAQTSGVDKALMFRLALEFSRANQDEAAQHWLEMAAQAGHQKAIEMTAGIGSPHLLHAEADAATRKLRFERVSGIIKRAFGIPCVVSGLVLIVWEIFFPLSRTILGALIYMVIGAGAASLGGVSLMSSSKAYQRAREGRRRSPYE